MLGLVDAWISASSQFLGLCIPYRLLIGPTLVLHLWQGWNRILDLTLEIGIRSLLWYFSWHTCKLFDTTWRLRGALIV